MFRHRYKVLLPAGRVLCRFDPRMGKTSTGTKIMADGWSKDAPVGWRHPETTKYKDQSGRGGIHCFTSPLHLAEDRCNSKHSRSSSGSLAGRTCKRAGREWSNAEHRINEKCRRTRFVFDFTVICLRARILSVTETVQFTSNEDLPKNEARNDSEL